MKVTAIYGSPRPQGTSSSIANHLLETIEPLGAEISKFNLNTLNYKGCQGCLACKGKSERCVIKDDLSEILDSITKTDVLIIATPVYYHDIPGQLKSLIDRTFSFFKTDYESNPKPSRLEREGKIIFIQSQGADEHQHKDVYQRHTFFFQIHGFTDTYHIQAANEKVPDDINDSIEKIVASLK